MSHLHHLRYRVADVGATRAEVVAAGFEVTVEDVDGSFVSVQSALLKGMTVELLRASPS